jgi:ketosteroid isomerase-like protein
LGGVTRKAVERYVEALNRRSPEEIACCVTPDFHNEHTSVAGTGLHGRDAYRARLVSFLEDFADLHYEVEDMLVEGDRAAVPYRMRFVYGGRPVSIRGVFRFRVREGLIAHRVDYWDSADFERQIS